MVSLTNVTLAILPVLLVDVSKEVYAPPLRSVLETVRVRPSEIHSVEGRVRLVLDPPGLVAAASATAQGAWA